MICIHSFYVRKCWQKGLTSGVEGLSNSLVLPSFVTAVTWAEWSADTCGCMTHSGCSTIYILVVVLLLTGNTWQILNICHWSEVLKDVLTVRIASYYTCESLISAIFRFFKLYFCSVLSSFPEGSKTITLTTSQRVLQRLKNNIFNDLAETEKVNSIPLLYRISSF